MRDTAWPDYEIKFTGTTIWRALLPWDEVVKLDPRFGTTAWWHAPTSHVYLSPVGGGLGEIAARESQDPKTQAASKVSWGVPVDNADVESHFTVSPSTSNFDVLSAFRSLNPIPVLYPHQETTLSPVSERTEVGAATNTPTSRTTSPPFKKS